MSDPKQLVKKVKIQQRGASTPARFASQNEAAGVNSHSDLCSSRSRDSISHVLINKLWNYCDILRDDGLSCGDYVGQLD